MRKIFAMLILVVSVALFTTNTLSAQVVSNTSEYRIMDIANPHYLWAEQVDSANLLLGLTEDNGSIYLKNNTIWFVNKMYNIEEQLVSLKTNMDGTVYFCNEDIYNPEAKVDTLGSYNAYDGQILNNKNEIMFLLTENNKNETIFSKKSAPCLSVGNKVDKTLAAYLAFKFYTEELNRRALIEK